MTDETYEKAVELKKDIDNLSEVIEDSDVKKNGLELLHLEPR